MGFFSFLPAEHSLCFRTIIHPLPGFIPKDPKKFSKEMDLRNFLFIVLSGLQKKQWELELDFSCSVPGFWKGFRLWTRIPWGFWVSGISVSCSKIGKCSHTGEILLIPSPGNSSWLHCWEILGLGELWRPRCLQEWSPRILILQAKTGENHSKMNFCFPWKFFCAIRDETPD